MRRLRFHGQYLLESPTGERIKGSSINSDGFTKKVFDSSNLVAWAKTIVIFTVNSQLNNLHCPFAIV